MKWRDGGSYEGDWEQNKAAGFGKFIHPDGDYYEGQWQENMANGTGKYIQ